MQHKFLLQYIKKEMEKAHIIAKGNEDFLKIFLPNEPWSAYRSNMSHWLSDKEDGVIRKRLFIVAVNEKLEFSDDIWGASEEKQNKAVLQGVKRLKEQLNDETVLFPWLAKATLTHKQERFLSFAKRVEVETIEDRLIKEEDFFSKTAMNQPFLVALFELMYARGEYGFVYTYIFPHLLDSYDNDIKRKKADIYASLSTPMYREAFEVFNAIKAETKAETIALKTAAISNIRREHLCASSLDKESLKALLETLMKCYTKVYVPKQDYVYYPAINLAYILALISYIFPNEVEMREGYSIKQIYHNVRDSLKKDKASEDTEQRYYAFMTELEFNMLLGLPHSVQELENMLETLRPTQNLVNQTKRQMGSFFVEIVEKFTTHNLKKFKEYLKIFDDYNDAIKVQ